MDRGDGMAVRGGSAEYNSPPPSLGGLECAGFTLDYDFDISTDTAYLKGVAIHEAIGAQKGFHFIDTDKLRLDPKERFEELFSIESEWTQEELVPYIA